MFPYYLPNELEKLGFARVGKNVIIKRNVQFYNPKKIHIGNNVIIEDYSIIAAGEDMAIGNNVQISSFCTLYGRFGITLESYSGVANRVTLYTETDDYFGYSMTNSTIPMEFKPKYHTGPIILRKHCIVGTNSTILPGITLGEGAAIGAHTLVTKSCKPWWFYFGVPAKEFKKRREDVIMLAQEYEKTLQKHT